MGTTTPPHADQQPMAESQSSSKELLRRCIVSGESLPPTSLIRFVTAPDKTITPDINGKLPGRGLWLKADRETLETAIDKNAFARAAKQKVSIPDDLLERTQDLLKKNCLSLIGMAKGAAQLVSGYEKVKDKLNAGKADLYIVASNCSKDSRRKLEYAAKNIPVIDLFDSNMLSQAVGIEHIMHIAIKKDGLSRRILVQSARLQGLANKNGVTQVNEAG